jgi:hypothetical protein
MTSDETPFEKKWGRAGLLRALTSAEAQVFASAGTGLLVWAGAISLESPFYFFREVALVIKEVISFVVVEAAYIIPNILYEVDSDKFSVNDATHIVATVAVIYLGFMFFKRSSLALKKISPFHWNFWPRFGLRRKLLLLSTLTAGVFAAWALGAFPEMGSQFLALGHHIASQFSIQNLSYVSQWLSHELVAAYRNKETVLPVAKGALAAVTTYATLEVGRVATHFASPLIRLGYAVYNRARPWFAGVNLSQPQRDWLHAAGSMMGGMIFGFSSLSFPLIPVLAWVALAPGLLLFAKEKPNLILALSKGGWNLGRYFHVVATWTLARPKWAGGIAVGVTVGAAAVGGFFSSSPMLGLVIMSGVIKAAYTGTAIAVLIAAGRGWAALVVHMRQATSHLTTRARDARQEMYWAAAKIAKPVLKFGKGP